MFKTKVILSCLLAFFLMSSYQPKEGAQIDELNGIPVFYNGNVANVFGRNITDTGYNLGLKYQCVEFVKRYYYEIYKHEMPESYGHAKDFFDPSIKDKGFNKTRGLDQFSNTREFKPQIGDILIFDSSEINPFGHMGIVSNVSKEEVEIVQQNFGIKSRHVMKLVNFQEIYTIADFNVLGWLRMKEISTQ